MVGADSLLLILLVTGTLLRPSSTDLVVGQSDLTIPENGTRCNALPWNLVDRVMSNNDSLVNVTFSPIEKNRLVMIDDSTPVNLTVTVRRRAAEVGPLCLYLNLTAPNTDDLSRPPTTIVVEGLPLIVAEHYTDVNRSHQQDFVEFRFVVQLSGSRLGRSVLMVTAQEQQRDLTDNGAVSSFEIYGSRRYSILVNRPSATTMENIFLLLLMAGMATNMVSFSVRLHTDIVKHHIRHPVSIIIACVLHYVILPPCAFLIGLIFDLRPFLRYTLLVISCSPSGAPTNFVSLCLRGDIYISVIMTAITNILSIGMMPFWLSTLGVYLMRQEFPGYSFDAPWLALLILALLFSVPAVIGNLYRRCVTQRTAVITSLVLRAFGITAVLTGVSYTLYSKFWALPYSDDWRVIVSVTIFSQLGYILGILLSLLARRSPQMTLTIAIEAYIYNFPHMILVMQVTCPQPESMLAYSVILVHLFNVVLVFVLALIVTTIIDVRMWRQNKRLVFAVGEDVSPEVADDYAMSNKIKQWEVGSDGTISSMSEHSQEGGKKDSSKYVRESFTSLPDKY